MAEKQSQRRREEEEALSLKTIAEEKFKLSKLKSALKYAKRAQRFCPDLDGISDMVTAFKILHVSSKSSSGGGPPDWYDILQVEPFSHINSIKKQYKKLALILHPDKNSCLASEEAFKRVGEAFRVLSDKIRRKEYDLKLRIALQSQATASTMAVETFWTSCSICRLFHQFERRYIGHNLMCPSCRKSFLAVEVPVNDESDDETKMRTRGRTRVNDSLDKNKKKESVERSRIGSIKRKISVRDSPERSRSSLRLRSQMKKVETRPELTLAEMQLEAKRKTQQEKMKMKEKVEKLEKVKEKHREEKNKKEKQREKEKGRKAKEKHVEVASKKSSDQEVMAVVDSDFYDFDKDRVERSFKRGQIWAVYDDDDGMPRHYGLIDEVVSVNPFEVKMSWLDLQNNGNETLICWEKSGFHISCGRFKLTRITSIDSVNFFSHLVDCERVAREVYMIYPKKGSIWALYSERELDGNEGSPSFRNRRCYDIAIFLTSYSEMHGLSMAYLEKVEGYKTIFKRREIGCHAIRWLEKDDVRLVSHQIPAKKISGMESSNLPKDCWELDPASLPPDLLSIGWGS